MHSVTVPLGACAVACCGVCCVCLQGHLRGGEDWLANPALPDDVVRETVPGGVAQSPSGARAALPGV